MAADKQLRRARWRSLGFDLQGLVAELDPTVTDINRQHDRLADETVHEGGGRIIVDIARRADLLDAALVHHHDAIGDFERLFLIMGDEDGRDVDLLMQRTEPLTQFLAYLGIQRPERLVEQQDTRRDRECPRKRNALSLAARQLAGITVSQPIELHEIEQFLDARADRCVIFADRPRLHAQAERDILEHRHVTEQRVVLEYESHLTLAGPPDKRVFAVERDLAGIRPIEACNDPQQRGLARTRRAEQRQQFAIADLEIDAVKSGERAEFLDQVFDFNRHAAIPPHRYAVRAWSWR